VLADHTARCWGAGGYGQLGDGSFPSRALQLATVDLTGIVAIRPGNSHTCALASSGDVACWGSAFLPTSTVAAGHPQPIALPGKAVSLAAGGDHDCAALVDGRVFCWGANDRGQLGDGTTTSPTGRTTAVQTVLCM
jgi:alpha-tubulin suppressor-like RCC1 family protein